MTLYELIKDGLDRNIMVYDIDLDSFKSKCRISKRLICLLIGIAKRNDIEPETLFIDIDQIPEIMVLLPYTEAWPKIGPGHINTIYGINVEFIDGLNVAESGETYLDFFKKMGGSLCYQNKNIIVAASKDKAILGCY